MFAMPSKCWMDLNVIYLTDRIVQGKAVPAFFSVSEKLETLLEEIPVG